MNTIKFRALYEFAEDYPPIPAKKLIPQWIKDLMPVSSSGNNTAKKCPPLIDMLTTGYYIRAVSNLKFVRTVENNEECLNVTGEWIVGDKKVTDIFDESSFGVSVMGMHSFDQAPIVINGIRKQIFKFYGMWVTTVPKGYSILYLPVSHFHQNFEILPAIVDADDDWEVPTAFPALASYNGTEETSWEVKAGDPIALAIPFKREEWSH